MAGNRNIRKMPLTRLSDAEYNELTNKHRRSRGTLNTSSGCTGRLSQKDYEKSFNMHYRGLGFNRNRVTSDDIG